MFSFLSHFFRQCAWALGVFCLFAFMMEWLIPDSVTPYIHLVPISIVAILMLVIDSVFLHEKKTIAEKIVLGCGIGILSVGIFLTYRGSGMSNLLAIGLLIAMMAGAGVFLFGREE